MTEDLAPPSDDPYRDALSAEDRAAYDRMDPGWPLTYEIKALRLLLYKLIGAPEEHSREIVGLLNTLCRVISTEARTANTSQSDHAVFFEADRALEELTGKDGR